MNRPLPIVVDRARKTLQLLCLGKGKNSQDALAESTYLRVSLTERFLGG